MLLESLDPDKTYDVEVYGAPSGQRVTYRPASGRALIGSRRVELILAGTTTVAFFTSKNALERC